MTVEKAKRVRKPAVKKPVIAKTVVLPAGFTPIEDFKPDFKQASHVHSMTKKHTFFDSNLGVIKGFMQRHDRALGVGEDVFKPYTVFLTENYRPLSNVTHFK